MSVPTPAPPARPLPSAAPSAQPWLQVTDRRFVVDFLLTALVAIITVTPYYSRTTEFVASLLLVIPVMFRRLAPTPALVATIAAGLVMAVVSGEALVAIAVVPIMVYSAARWGSVNLSHLALGAGIFGSVLGPTRWFWGSYDGFTRLPVVLGIMVACAGIVVGAYLIGRRRSEALDVRDREQAAQAERQRLIAAEQQQRSLSAAVSERQRIARELHDIVAHSLSVIVVQAEGGKALTSRYPERAPEVLGTIADASREALAEMRQMVGLLRNELDDPATRRPTPGLGELSELVRRSGTGARLEVHGAQPWVPTAIGLTVYRIVQESLTNMLKHAGPRPEGLVLVDYLPDAIRIQVHDRGRGAAAHPGPRRDGGGHGLRGMVERVGLHGGTLTAGPRPGGGFSVTAVVPLPPRGRLQP